MPTQLNNQVLLTIDTPTRTGHIYSRELAESIAKQGAERVELLGRPLFAPLTERGDAWDANNIYLRDVSHIARNVRIEGDQLLADITLLETGPGNALAAVIAADVPIAFAPSGVGVLQPGGKIASRGYDLLTIDAVSGEEQ